MNTRLLLSLAVVAVAVLAAPAAKKADAPKEHSKAAKKHLEDFKAITDAYTNGMTVLHKKFTKEVFAEVKKENAEQKKATNEAAAAKKKGVEVTVPPMRLTQSGWALKNALDKLENTKAKKMADFKKNTDPNVVQEIIEYNKTRAAGKPASKTTPKPAGKAKKQ
ncbi:hypothetical protein PRIPAC_70434 [Pristionchus pacificus]|uniref:Uncharacterized protein n=1 Tax=Pristionchus pacificus TaxID=54126 RepID=A0A454Y0Z9_PRIPA|nr:hypothetical protein PRIPAC_70434 [Pristionchus pacificus]|eukprot:PDM73799.1 hypothetical protein PRIPAC_41155 [Pristionchus pacificus]